MSEVFKYAQDVVDRIKSAINDEKKQIESKCDIENEEFLSYGKYTWEENLNLEDQASMHEYTNNASSAANFKRRRYRVLDEALKRPLKGIITLDYGDDNIVETNIGITTIIDKDLNQVLCDWRTPVGKAISSPILGKIKIKTPGGVVECTLLKRIQTITDKGELLSATSSSLYIGDDALQSVLSQNSSDKMKEMVSTIQEEQDEVIRNLSDRKIIVQGCAGSGKTAVALHRLSFLMGNDEKANSSNMLIFSPSDTFSEYISDVLPSLGDENISHTTFSDFADRFVYKFDRIESFFEFLSKYYEGMNSEEKNKLNKFKFSKEYKEALDKYILRLSNSYKFTSDLSVSGYSINKDYLNKILDSEQNSSMPTKIEAVSYAILSLLSGKTKATIDYVRAIVTRTLLFPKADKNSEEVRKPFDAKMAYKNFLLSEEFIEAYGCPGNRVSPKLLEYPDVIGLLYLNFQILGYPVQKKIRHLVVDEVQDYSPMQLEMISKLFPGATITVLGDAKQTINPYHRYESLEEMKEFFGQSALYLELNKAYRSSPEIMNYVKGIIDDDRIIPVRNATNNPVELKEVDKKELFTTLVTDIIRLKEKGFDKICIVTKSSKEAEAIYEGLKDLIDGIKVICDNEKKGVDTAIATSYNAKGLEFDAVICYNDMDNSYSEEEKCLYYVACTRAQHDLVIYNEPKGLRKRLKQND